VAAGPGSLVHREHRAHEVHAARAQRRDEGPHGAAASTERVGPHAHAAVVDLHRLAEERIGQEHREPRRVDTADLLEHVAAEGREARGEPAAVAQPLPDGGHGARRKRRSDLVVQGLEAHPHREASAVRAALGGRGGERRAPFRRAPLWPLLSEAPVLRRGDAVAHGVARAPQAAGNLANASARSPVHQDLDVVVHGHPPAAHPATSLPEAGWQAQIQDGAGWVISVNGWVISVNEIGGGGSYP
jgi:hypothetical protein